MPKIPHQQRAKVIVELLKNGKVGVMPTDTIYGLVGSALNPQTIEEIYKLRNRDNSKPMIVLIASLEDLLVFHIHLTDQQKNYLQKIWPNPVSVILPCPNEEFSYLHRGKKSLAFRVPKNNMLINILKQTGPLVAPSANLQQQKPAENIVEAKNYFKDKIAFYINGGELKSKPSTVVQLYEDGKKIILREGVFRNLK